MDTLQAQKVKELVAEHNLPAEIVTRCVAQDGLVDTEKLGIAMQTRSFVQSGKANVDQAEIGRLNATYYDAADKKDVRAMMASQDRIYALGGRLAARKV